MAQPKTYDELAELERPFTEPPYRPSRGLVYGATGLARQQFRAVGIPALGAALIAYRGVRVAAAMVPYLQALWDYAGRMGIPLRLVSGYRSPEQQEALRLRWESGDPSVVYPPAEHSYHESGLAVDLESSQLSTLGRFWESLGARWGGRFGDPVHFDLGRA